MQARMKMFGQNHPDMLTSVSNLGMMLSNQAKYKEAEAMYRRALEGYNKVFGPEHPDTLTSMTGLVSTYVHHGL
jgi:hypothetical protein